MSPSGSHRRDRLKHPLGLKLARVLGLRHVLCGHQKRLLDTPLPLRGVREVSTAPKWGPTAPSVRLRRKSAIGNHRCPNFAAQ